MPHWSPERSPPPPPPASHRRSSALLLLLLLLARVHPWKQATPGAAGWARRARWPPPPQLLLPLRRRHSSSSGRRRCRSSLSRRAVWVGEWRRLVAPALAVAALEGIPRLDVNLLSLHLASPARDQVYWKEENKSYEEHVKKLLEIIPPKGKEFLRSIKHILEREKIGFGGSVMGVRHLKSILLKRNQVRREPENGSQGGDWETKNLAGCGNGQNKTLDVYYHHKIFGLGIEGVVPPELLPKSNRYLIAATPETDGGGSGPDPEEGAVPMDSDNVMAVDGQVEP
ncbi:hypothetical protein ACP4OV_022630 [Aristida adscensionis]